MEKKEHALALISMIRGLVNPNRPNGVSCYQLEEASQLLNKLDMIITCQPPALSTATICAEAAAELDRLCIESGEYISGLALVRYRLMAAACPAPNIEDYCPPPNEEAQAVAEAVNKHRRLCYCHYCQEFATLPNARRYEVSYWQTVPEAECELCIQERHAHLVGLAYPDAQGRTITVLNVDEWGTALMERGGEHWGCHAEYLEDIKAEMEAAL